MKIKHILANLTDKCIKKEQRTKIYLISSKPKLLQSKLQNKIW